LIVPGNFLAGFDCLFDYLFDLEFFVVAFHY
jgi:hypothetical protein